MEFWGVEVKPGDSLNVTPEQGKLIHISQAALGEVKNSKGAASVPLHLKIDDGNFVLGTLSAEGRPQLAFDLVFEKEFELSHDWKNGSVYFCGYTADNPYAEEQLDSDLESSDEEEDHPLNTKENGKHEPNIGGAKPAKSKATPVKPESSAKTKVTLVEPKKDEESHGAEDSDSEDDTEFGSSDDMFESDDSDDDDDDDDESDDEDEETPKKDVPAKKRPSESAIKTPVPAKKGKSDTPQKTDGKKGGVHTATPHPGKSNKAKEQTPKSSGQSSCITCSKTFNSDGALQSHVKAKHGGK